MSDLLDASVWLPLSVPDHIHHARAMRYWQRAAAEAVVLCRITALALCRHLTSAEVVGVTRRLDGAAAWAVLAAPGLAWREDRPGLDELLGGWARRLDLRGGGWTDAYLAAIAVAGGYRLVAFDGCFRRYPGVSFSHLRA